MGDMAPLSTHITGKSRHAVRTTHEDDVSRPLEVPDVTHSGCSSPGWPIGGSSQLWARHHKDRHSSSDSVTWLSQQEEGGWESDHDSDTSTPDFKRGRHTGDRKQYPA